MVFSYSQEFSFEISIISKLNFYIVSTQRPFLHQDFLPSLACDSMCCTRLNLVLMMINEQEKVKSQVSSLKKQAQRKISISSMKS